MPNKKNATINKTEGRLKKDLDREYNLFNSVPVSIWEMDFSATKDFIDSLQKNGAGNLRGYFDNNPEAIVRCIQMVRIIDINKATLLMYEAENKKELLTKLNKVFDGTTYKVFKEGFIALAEGNSWFASDASTKTLKGKKNYIYLALSVVPGHENTWSRVLLSFTDINKRKQIEQQLIKSYEYLEKLNNSLQEVIFTVKLPERTIEYANNSIERVFGYTPEECIGKTTIFLYPSSNEYYSFGSKLNSVIDRGDKLLNTEHQFMRKNGEIFPAEVTTTLLMENDKITRVISILRDVTERKKEEAKLRESEARLAEAQRIAHLGNWDWNIEQNILVWSDEIYRIFGLNPHIFKATYEAFLERVHPEDREYVKKVVDESVYHGKPYDIDHRIILPDKTVRVVHEMGEVTFNEAGRPIRMIGTVHDITERKRAEDELRALSHDLVHLQESERSKIGRELHDVIGQSLTALQLLLNRISRIAMDNIKNEINEAQTQIIELMKSVRELSVDLYPTMLDNLGLLPALTWQFDRFTKLTQVVVSFKHSGLKKNFTPEIILAIYRIIQEALTNIARYAGVNEANVNIFADKNTVHIIVEDKGKGFNLDNVDVCKSTGLSGMRERALAIGGKLVIETSPELGTKIIAELPLLHRAKSKKSKQ